MVLIALPGIVCGIGLNPLNAGNTSYLLWIFMGFLVVPAVPMLSSGRPGDMFGRVRIGVSGTVAHFMLHDIGVRKHAQMDWRGNLLFAAGLIAILAGITYGLLPYGGHPMGWTSPRVLTALFGGLVLLVIFVYAETKVAEPLFRISLFRIQAFTAANIASLMLAMGRGGMQFMLIIWRGSGCRCPAAATARPRCGPASTRCP